MSQATQIHSVKDLLASAQEILVMVGAKANLDTLAASTAFFLSLQQTEKEVSLASPQTPTQPHQALAGLDQIKTEISNKNLVISFAYQETAVEKVNYHIGQETNRFYLTVEPQKNQRPLDKETVEVNYTGAKADLIFLFGVHDYETLGNLYLGNEQLFANTNVVTIHNFAPEIGDLKITAEEELNLSSVTTNLLQQFELGVSAEAATNLLLSLETATKNFSSLSTTPKVFDQAAWLMRQGARRLKAKARAQEVEGQAAEERGVEKQTAEKQVVLAAK